MTAFFPDVPKINFGGPKSRNPLEFKHYNPDEVVGGKTMKEHLRFSVVYWHTFCNPLSDPFGVGTAHRPWDDGSNSVPNAQRKAKMAFEFFEKLGAPFYAFHDRDIAPEGSTLKESHAKLDEVVKVLKDEQARTGVKLLWGTANLFTNPRYMHGAATSSNFDVFAFAAAQVKKAMEITHELGGAGYTFWGGREGYSTLLNTDMKRESRSPRPVPPHGGQLQETNRFPRHLLHRAEAQGADQAPVRLGRRRLPEFPEDLQPAAALQAQPRDQPRDARRARDDARDGGGHRRGALGSIDANTGDYLLGWDTDQFPTNIYLTTQCMHCILDMGGFTTGGVNFDAKVRRESFEPIDLFYAHIGGMDAFARGLKTAQAIITDGRLADFVKSRYQSWDCELGRRVESGQCNLGDLEAYIVPKGDAARNVSGRQEMLENLINDFF